MASSCNPVIPALKERAHTLDGIRGVAALCVLLTHIMPSHLPILPHHYLAVDLFFVISGFVLGASYDRKLRDGSLPFLTFMAKRLIRLYPLFLLGLVIGFAAALLFLTYTGVSLFKPEAWIPGAPLMASISQFLFALLMLPAPYFSRLYTLNPPAWTLINELAVNIVYGILRSRFSSRLCFLLVSIGSVFMAVHQHQMSSFDAGYNWDGIKEGFCRAFCAFWVGFAIFKAKEKLLPLFPFTQSVKSDGLAFSLVLFVVLILLMPVLGTHERLYNEIIIYIFFPLLVAGSSLVLPHTQGLTDLFTRLGQMSYGIYVLQMPLLYLFLICLIWAGITQAFFPDPIISASFVPVLLTSIFILDARYDRPIQRWITMRLKRLTQPPP